MRTATLLLLLVVVTPVEVVGQSFAVALDVSAYEASGAPLRDLKQEDFLIYEDGQQQLIRSFVPIDRPYSALLLIDRSFGMERYWDPLTPAINRFIDELRPSDRLAIAAFDERRGNAFLVDWRAAETGQVQTVPIDPNVMGAGYWFYFTLHRGESGGVQPNPKNFYGALGWAIKQLATVTGRKSLVVFSDGVQTRTPIKVVNEDGRQVMKRLDATEDKEFMRVLRTVKEAEIPIYFMALNTDLNPNGAFPGDLDARIQTRSRIQRLVESSGGRAVFPQKPEEVVELYAEIGRDLVTSYRLGYVSSQTVHDGKYRRVEVRVRGAKRIRQSINGYEAR